MQQLSNLWKLWMDSHWMGPGLFAILVVLMLIGAISWLLVLAAAVFVIVELAWKTHRNRHNDPKDLPTG